jgi:hypothetical protein
VRGGELDGGRARWWGGRYDVAVREWEEGGEGWEFDGGGAQLCGGRYGVMVKALSSGDRVGGHGCQARGGTISSRRRGSRSCGGCRRGKVRLEGVGATRAEVEGGGHAICLTHVNRPLNLPQLHNFID